MTADSSDSEKKMESASAWPKGLLRGHADTHAPLLIAPAAAQKLYKVMKLEHAISSIEGNYLHFNRVDGYRDFPGADTEDGAQLPQDASVNAATAFEKSPDFSLSDYYIRARGRTYASCFAASNSEYIWDNYGAGGSRGKVGLVFDAEKLRARINQTVAGETSALMVGGNRCLQLFSVNSAMVEYVDRSSARENLETFANPIRYTFIKDQAFEKEEEYRIALSAFGMGHFAMADGSILVFPPDLQLAFNFRDAIGGGTIEAILLSPDADVPALEHSLRNAGVATQVRDIPPATGIVTRRAETSWLGGKV
jgi:hypothetical protein